MWEDKQERERERNDRLDGRRRGDEEMQPSTCARLRERRLAFTNSSQTVAAGGGLSLRFRVRTPKKVYGRF